MQVKIVLEGAGGVLGESTPFATDEDHITHEVAEWIVSNGPIAPGDTIRIVDVDREALLEKVSRARAARQPERPADVWQGAWEKARED